MREYSDQVTERKYFVEPHIPGFAEFGKWKGKRVLEIGCGIGTDTLEFAKAGASVIAIDLSEKSLEIARKRAVANDVRNIDFRRMSAEDHLILPDLTYNLIYAFGSIHHSPSPETIVGNMRYYSGLDTTLKLMVYNKYSWKALWILLKYGRGKFWKFSELIAKYSEAQTGCPVTHVYSRRSIKKLIESAGFRVTKISVDHIFPYRIEDYKNYRYVREWYWRWMPAKMFRWLEKHFGWHLLVEADA
jgi:SAM-dependent methyltransferase